MDSPSRHSDTLNFIVHFLHTNGLYAAEEALVRELENRYPEVEGSSPVSQPEADDSQEDTFAFTSSTIQRHGEALPEGGARNQSREEALAEKPTESGLGTAPGGSSQGILVPDVSAGQEADGGEESDEYEDDDDPGYVREEIRSQEVFIARELDISDEDGSGRGADVYHQALAFQGQQWGDDGGDHSGSSDGRGSSYFSGERVQRDKSSSASPLAQEDAPADRGAATQQGERRTVVIGEPVYPADSPARSAFSASAVASPALGTASASKLRPPRAASSGEVSRRKTLKAQAGMAEEMAANSQAAAIAAVAASSGATYLDAGAKAADLRAASAAADAKGAVQGGATIGRSFLDPLGVFEKVTDVFNRRVQPRSDSESSKVSTQGAAPPEVAATDAAQELEQPANQDGVVAEAAVTVEQQVEVAVGEDTSSRFAALTIKPGRDVSIDAENMSTKNDLKTPTFGFSAVKTPEPASPSGRSEEDEAFSFPVTPPSEPAAPGAVFSSWQSFRKRPSKGTASSGYDTDDDLSMSRASDSFSTELTSDMRVGGSCSSPDIQSALRFAALEPSASPHTSGALLQHSPSTSSTSASHSLQHQGSPSAALPPSDTKPQAATSSGSIPEVSSGQDGPALLAEPEPLRLHKEISLAQDLLAAALQPATAAEREAGRQPPSLDPVPEGHDTSASADDLDCAPLASQSSMSQLALADLASDGPAGSSLIAREASTPPQTRPTALPKVASVDLMPRSGRLPETRQKAAAGRQPSPGEPAAGRATGRAARAPFDGGGGPCRLATVSRAGEAPASKDASSALPGGEQPAASALAKAEPHASMSGSEHSSVSAGQQQQLALRPLDVSTSLPQQNLVALHSTALQSNEAARSPDTAAALHNGADAGASEEASGRTKRGAARPEAGKDALAGLSPSSNKERDNSSSAGATERGAPHAAVVFEYDPEYIERKYEIMTLKVIHRRRRTGFEETKDFPIRVNDLIAGRYQVMDFLGSAAFSKAVQALDVRTGRLVCLKIIKNNKDYFDQSLDEVKLLSYINTADPADEHGLLRLYDYFYYKEHLFLVCELLRANLYEFQKYNRESGDAPYFILPRVQSVARQVLRSLAFLHSLGLIHSDLKPENILIKSYSRCEVKVIDFGSSCFTTDQLSSYVQSRSYRAPEVILGLPYGQKVDVWSLGCILAELLSGFVLFQNDSLATLLARLEGILGPVPERLLREGRYAHRYYTRSGALFDRNPRTHRYEYLHPKRTSLRKRVAEADQGCLGFLAHVLTVDPDKRPSAEEALQHPWLQHCYPPIPTE